MELALDHCGAAGVWLKRKTPGFQERQYRERNDFTPGLQRFEGELKSGWNTIFLKLTGNGELEAAFRLQLLDPGSKAALALEQEPGRSILGVTGSGKVEPPEVPPLQAVARLPEGPEKRLPPCSMGRFPGARAKGRRGSEPGSG